MARSFRTGAALSLCAVLFPAGCDSPISSPELRPSAAVIADGTVVTTVKDEVPIGPDRPVFVSAPCLSDGEILEISGMIGVAHTLTLEPRDKTYRMTLDSRAWAEQVQLAGESGVVARVVGADKLQVAEEVVLPHEMGWSQMMAAVQIFTFSEATLTRRGEPVQASVVTGVTIEVTEDFGINTTLESVEIVCPPPPDTDDGAIVVAVQDKLNVDTEVTTPCFNDGVAEKVSVNGVLGVLHHLRLMPIDGMDTYGMDLSTVGWTQGIQLIGLVSAADAIAVGADKVQVTGDVMLPAAVTTFSSFGFVGSLPRDPLTPAINFRQRLTIEIAEDFGITTKLDEIEIICPPSQVVNG
jgi:hypothetical protein